MITHIAFPSGNLWKWEIASGSKFIWADILDAGIPRSLFGPSSTEILFSVYNNNGNYVEFRSMNINGTASPTNWAKRINLPTSSSDGYNNGLYIDIPNSKGYHFIHLGDKFVLITLDTTNGNQIGDRFLFSKTWNSDSMGFNMYFNDSKLYVSFMWSSDTHFFIYNTSSSTFHSFYKFDNISKMRWVSILGCQFNKKR